MPRGPTVRALASPRCGETGPEVPGLRAPPAAEPAAPASGGSRRSHLLLPVAPSNEPWSWISLQPLVNFFLDNCGCTAWSVP